jgi:hypothetical protein
MTFCPFIDSERSNAPDLTDVGMFYRELTIHADASGAEADVIISFGRKEESSERVIFYELDPTQMPAGPSSSLPLPVMITVGKYAVTAQRLIWVRNDMTFTAEGDVSVQDGSAEKRVGKAQLEVKRGSVRITTRD